MGPSIGGGGGIPLISQTPTLGSRPRPLKGTISRTVTRTPMKGIVSTTGQPPLKGGANSNGRGESFAPPGLGIPGQTGTPTPIRLVIQKTGGGSATGLRPLLPLIPFLPFRPRIERVWRIPSGLDRRYLQLWDPWLKQYTKVPGEPSLITNPFRFFRRPIQIPRLKFTPGPWGSGVGSTIGDIIDILDGNWKKWPSFDPSNPPILTPFGWYIPPQKKYDA